MEQETLPEITTTPDFKAQVEQTCQSFHLSYSTVVTCLLEAWMRGDILLDIDPDHDFLSGVHEAFRSDEVRQAIRQLGTRYDPDRNYPHAVKA